MKRYKKLLLFACGVVCGLVAAWSWGLLQSRVGSAPGGEMLLLPLMGVLLWLGYNLRDLFGTRQERR